MPDEENKQLNIPNHIAIIPDGNRRWAKERGLPEMEGHRKGAEITDKLLEKARDLGVHTMTLWGFSTENWKRPKNETDNLMKIFEDLFNKQLKKAKENMVRVIHIGRKDRISESLRKAIEKVEEETKDFTKHVLNIAIDYGGQDEILRAIEKIIEDGIDPKDLWKEVGKMYGKYPYFAFKNYLDTKDQPYPYPDLVIRTSGEQRTSGLMPWQIAYSEFYFADVHFPDFTPNELQKAVEDYSKRNRRFGGGDKK